MSDLFVQSRGLGPVAGPRSDRRQEREGRVGKRGLERSIAGWCSECKWSGGRIGAAGWGVQGGSF